MSCWSFLSLQQSQKHKAEHVHKHCSVSKLVILITVNVAAQKLRSPLSQTVTQESPSAESVCQPLSDCVLMCKNQCHCMLTTGA